MDSNTLIGIIGSGSMGAGIAQVAAEAGHHVRVYDNNPAALERADASMRKLFDKLVTKGKRTQEAADATIARITYVSDMLNLNQAGLIIEAIIENLQIKQRVFEELSNGVSASTVLATNTSSLSVTAIAASAKTPSQVVGLHFFNPAALMKLVEIVPAAQTDPALIETLTTLMRSWKKEPVVAQDTPGFIVNRVARPFYSEAFRIYDEGLAQPHEIDAAMEALGFRMGPFTLTDFIGHDVNFAVTESMFHSYWGEPRYRPSFAQKRLVDAGYHGRKANRGFYEYDENKKAIRPASTLTEEQNKVIQDRVMAVLINEAADALHFGVASAEDIDKAMLKGVNYPKGLLAWADEIGRPVLIDRLDALYAKYHEGRYRVSAGLR
ncbi:MAG: 3-hydroxyacyl-CoA dehydrogenase NAD-binding domain-containing protein [Saprospiraceae bacterium]